MLNRGDDSEMLGLALCSGTLIYHQTLNRFSVVCPDVTWYHLVIIFCSLETTEILMNAQGVSS